MDVLEQTYESPLRTTLMTCTKSDFLTRHLDAYFSRHRGPNDRLAFSLAAMACLVAVLSCGQAQATIVTYAMNLEFSGGTAPSASAPWVVVNLDDHNQSGVVDLKVTAPGLTGSENLASLYLNLDPALDPNDLIFSSIVKSRAFTTPTISTGTNSFKADGDGKYDLLFGFSVGGAPDTFVQGDTIELSISGIATLNAVSFFEFSLPAGGHGPYTSAAHVQNTGGGGQSGWITDGTNGGPNIPEPGSATLLVLGAVGALGYRGWRRSGSRKLLASRR
jgi:hypothetical protein